jgi:hypothetical protein
MRGRNRMGTVWTFEHPGEGGGTWYGAQYPLGATQYYRTAEARSKAISGYRRAIEATGGYVAVIDGQVR